METNQRDTLLRPKNVSKGNSGSKSFKPGTGTRYQVRLTATTVQEMIRELSTALSLSPDGAKLDFHFGQRTNNTNGRTFEAGFFYVKPLQSESVESDIERAVTPPAKFKRVAPNNGNDAA